MLLSKTHGPDSKKNRKKLMCKGTGIKTDFVSEGEKLRYNNR